LNRTIHHGNVVLASGMYDPLCWLKQTPRERNASVAVQDGADGDLARVLSQCPYPSFVVEQVVRVNDSPERQCDANLWQERGQGSVQLIHQVQARLFDVANGNSTARGDRGSSGIVSQKVCLSLAAKVREAQVRASN
jgi:hypothetical protein